MIHESYLMRMIKICQAGIFFFFIKKTKDFIVYKKGGCYRRRDVIHTGYFSACQI